MSSETHIIKLTKSVLDRMLTFKTTVDIQNYVMNKTHADFREFEAEVSINNPIKGTGVLADRTNITTGTSVYKKEFYHNNVDVGAHELGAYVGLFPFDDASASYIFTLLEVYGDDVVNVVNPGGVGGSRAWHQEIKDNYDFRDAVQKQKAREAFAKHFLADWNNVPEVAPLRMIALKKQRNAFAHQGNARINFEEFISDSLAMVCHIAFLTTGVDRISSYPWEDYMDTLNPRT